MYYFLVILSLFFCLFQDMGTVAHANGDEGKETTTYGERWTEDVDKSIYDSEVEDKKYTNISKDPEPVAAVGGTLGVLLAEFLNGVSDFVDSVFEMLGLTLDNILYGRVNGSGVKAEINGKNYRIALYTYETSKGNPYGIVSMAVYALLRKMCYILVPVLFGMKGAIAMSRTNTQQAKKDFVEVAKNTAIFFILMVTMPWILDLFLYIRDSLLYGVSRIGWNALGMAGTVDVASAFDKLAEADTGDFMLALLRLASKILTLYFGFLYVGVAISMIVCVISFPFVCISSILTPNILTEWFKNVFANLMVPVIDTTLLLIPLMFTLFGDSLAIGIIQIMAMFMLLPARGEFRRILRLNSSIGMEMAAAGGMMSALSLAGAAVKGTAGMIAGTKQGYDLEKQARMYDEMADEDEKFVMEESVGNGCAAPDEYSSTSSAGSGSGSGRVDSSSTITGADASGEGVEKGASAVTSADNGNADTGVDAVGEGTGTIASGSDISASSTSFSDQVTASDLGSSKPDYSDIYRKYANTGNFQSGQFASGLSNRDKAKLYREKAALQSAKVGAQFAGGLLGASLGSAIAVGGNAGLGYNATMGAALGESGVRMAGGVVDSLRAGLGYRGTAVSGQGVLGQDVSGSSSMDTSADVMAMSAATDLSAQVNEPVQDTIGIEDGSGLGNELYRGNQAYFQNAVFGMSEMVGSDAFDDAFYQAGEEWSDVVGTVRDDSSSEDESGSVTVWQDTAKDRYEYFRTQKVEPMLDQYFQDKLSSDEIQRPRGMDEHDFERAKFDIGERTSKHIRSDGNKYLSMNGLQSAGYDFTNGFKKVQRSDS